MDKIIVNNIGTRPGHLRKSFLHMSALVLMLGAAMSPLSAKVEDSDKRPDTSGSAKTAQMVASEVSWSGMEWMLEASNLDINKIRLVPDRSNPSEGLRGSTSYAGISTLGNSEYSIHLSPIELDLAKSGNLVGQYTILHELGHAVQNEHRGRTMVATEFLTETDASALSEIFSANEMFGRQSREVSYLSDGEGEAFSDAFAMAALIKHYGLTPSVIALMNSEASDRFENGPKGSVIGHETYHGIGYYAIKRALESDGVVSDVVQQAKKWASQGVSDFILTANSNNTRVIFNTDEIAERVVEARLISITGALHRAVLLYDPSRAFEVANTAEERSLLETAMKGDYNEFIKATESFVEKSEDSLGGLEVNLNGLKKRVEAWRAANPNAIMQDGEAPEIGTGIKPKP